MRVPETCRRSKDSKDRSRWCVAGRVTRFDYYYCQKAAGSSFLFFLSFLPSPPLFPTGRKKTFFHARHLCTRHSSYAVCICTRLFTNLNANSVDGELPPLLSSRLQPLFLVDPREIFSLGFSFFCGIVALILLLFPFFFFFFRKIETNLYQMLVFGRRSVFRRVDYC